MSSNNADGAATQSGAVGAAVNLSVPPLAELQMRRSDKWAGYGPGVISATIAEMDFPVADPIVEVLHARLGDTISATHRATSPDWLKRSRGSLRAG